MSPELKRSSENYEQKKEQIKEAAKDFIAYYGYHKTTLDDIANKVGIKKNSIYYYFKSKEDLFNEIIIEIYAAKITDYEKASLKSKSTIDKIKTFLLTIVSQKYKESKQYKITPGAFIEIGRIIEESYKELFENTRLLLSTIIREGISTGEFRKHDAEETAKIILEFTQALEFFEYSKTTSKFITESEQKKLEERLVNFIDLIYTGIQNVK
ncbi:transcriptional regulator, tetr family [hydrocarbon metagenome]|uniref:Transcriptional regulator, tetr family n=1 Tax=hydrocarbon metagenome TaxID=938273 RepID=A0A0W8FV80_9ZZZZ